MEHEDDQYGNREVATVPSYWSVGQTIDYMRSASAEDRRYLLYNPVVKMKVTTQGEEVINLLHAVCEHKNVVGFDIVELAPLPESNQSEFLAAKLAYKLLGYSMLLNK